MNEQRSRSSQWIWSIGLYLYGVAVVATAVWLLRDLLRHIVA